MRKRGAIHAHTDTDLLWSWALLGLDLLDPLVEFAFACGKVEQAAEKEWLCLSASRETRWHKCTLRQRRAKGRVFG